MKYYYKAKIIEFTDIKDHEKFDFLKYIIDFLEKINK